VARSKNSTAANHELATELMQLMVYTAHRRAERERTPG
jgi:hypothetical protein